MERKKEQQKIKNDGGVLSMQFEPEVAVEIIYAETYDPVEKKVRKIPKDQMPHYGKDKLNVFAGDTYVLLLQKNEQNKVLLVQNYRKRENHEPGAVVYEATIREGKVARTPIANLNSVGNSTTINDIIYLTWIED